MGDHLLLVGMMGAGKSAVGGRLARRMGRSHVDTDAEVERQTGSTVSAIFVGRGEDAFRDLERTALRSVLGREEPTVVSVGGGAVIDPANRALMHESGAAVWLRARPDTLWTRVADTEDRPLLGGGDERTRRATLERLVAERRPLYAEVATCTVDTDGLDPDQVAELVLAAVGRGVP